MLEGLSSLLTELEGSMRRLFVLAAIFCLSLLAIGSVQADLLVTNGAVHQFDEQTGELLSIWEVPPGADLKGGVTVGPDANVYVGDQAAGGVFRFDGATGDLIDTFVQPGSGGMSAAKCLAFGPDGNLYVSFDYSILRSAEAQGTSSTYLLLTQRHKARVIPLSSGRMGISTPDVGTIRSTALMEAQALSLMSSPRLTNPVT